MRNTTLTFYMQVLASVAILMAFVLPVHTIQAVVVCQTQDDDTYPWVCTRGATDPAPPSSCELANASGTQFNCPTNITAPTSPSTDNIVRSCAPAPGAKGFYVCAPLQAGTTGCTEQGATSMLCKSVPKGYTLSSSVSPNAGGTLPPVTPPAAVQPLNTGSACAGTGGTQLGYCPLEPLPGLPNPANITLPDLLNALFKILLSLGALFAVVMLTLGGLEYMVSAVPGVKSQGRERAWAAIWGLLLLAASYLILYTINPNLTKFTLFGQSSAPQSSTQSPATKNAAVDTTIHTFTPSTIQWNAISNSVCGTKLPCDFILGTVTNVSSMDSAGNIYPDLVTFITQCTAGRYDQVLNKDRAGAIRAYNAELVGEPGRTGLACLLQ